MNERKLAKMNEIPISITYQINNLAMKSRNKVSLERKLIKERDLII